MRDKCNRCIYACPVNVGEDCEMLRACLYILLRGQRRWGISKRKPTCESSQVGFFYPASGP